jgi:hypothetical protein
VEPSFFKLPDIILPASVYPFVTENPFRFSNGDTFISYIITSHYVKSNLSDHRKLNLPPSRKRFGLTAFLSEYRNTITRNKGAPRPMKDAVRKLNVEYRFNLSDQEIDLVAKQAEEAALLFQPLFEVDVTGVTPLTKIDKRVKKTAAVKKGKK